MTYIGKCKHGKVVAGLHAESYSDKEKSKVVADWIKRGLSVTQIESGAKMEWCDECASPKIKPPKSKQAELI